MPNLSSIRAAGSRVRLSGRTTLTRTVVPAHPGAVVRLRHRLRGVRARQAPCPGGGATTRRSAGGARSRGQLLWIGLHEPALEQLEGIGEEFGLHTLAVEDAVHAHNRPKLERYEDTLASRCSRPPPGYVGHAGADHRRPNRSRPAR